MSLLVLKVIIIVFCIYGFLSVLNDLFISNINKNLICVMYVKNIENEIEEYLRTIKYCKINFKKIFIFDLNSTDDTLNILKKYERDNDEVYILKNDK